MKQAIQIQLNFYEYETITVQIEYNNGLEEHTASANMMTLTDNCLTIEEEENTYLYPIDKIDCITIKQEED